MKVLITSAVFLVFVAGAFGYCEEFSMDLMIDSEGGGDFTITYESTDTAYCSENTGADIVAEYRNSGGLVENIVITTHGVGPEKVEVSYDLYFNAIENTNDYGVFGFFYDIDYTLTLSQNENNDFTMNISTEVEKEDKYKDYKYDFKVECPNNVITTNGTVSPANPKEVTWSFTFYQLVEKGSTDLTITY